MQKPKLLLVADTYYPKVDGTLRFIEEFIKRAHRDFDLSLLVPDYGIKRGNKVRYLEVSRKLKISDYASIKFSKKNIKLIKEAVKEADIVFVQGPALASFLGVRYAHKYNKKVIFYTHTLTWELFAKFFPKWLNWLLFRILRGLTFHYYNRCQSIYVPYQGLKEKLIDEGVRSKIEVARLGVDINRFTPVRDKKAAKAKLGIDADSFVIGYVGRISKEKNTKMLLEAFERVNKSRDVYLLMVGDGPEDQVKQFKEHKNCLVTGFVHNVEHFLQAMDLFVMPSLTETTSLVTLEAMATGLPVIATKVGFMQKYIIKNYNGTFVPRKSIALLAVKIDKLIKDQELRVKLGTNARRTIAYSFSWDRSINKIKRLILQDYHQEEEA